jgi:hypothetical protein
LTKITQINYKETNGTLSLEQELKLKKAGLTALSTILKSLVAWIEKDNVKAKEKDSNQTQEEEEITEEEDNNSSFISEAKDFMEEKKEEKEEEKEEKDEEKKDENDESMANKLEKQRNTKRILNNGFKLFKSKPEKGKKKIKK